MNDKNIMKFSELPLEAKQLIHQFNMQEQLIMEKEIDGMTDEQVDTALKEVGIRFDCNNIYTKLQRIITAKNEKSGADSQPVKTTLISTLKEAIKEGLTQGKRRVLSLKAEIIEANTVYVPYEQTLRATHKSDQNEYKELLIEIESSNNNFPEWVLGRQIIVRNELDSNDIDKYFALIIPPPEDDDDAPEKASLLITICDDKGHEAEIELSERKSKGCFKIQEVLSDNLTEFTIDVLDK